MYELSIEAMRQYRDRSGDEGVDGIIEEVNEQAKPVEIYAEMLENGEVYRKSYACRRLSDLGATQYRDELRKYVDNKNRDLAYNAAMGLAKFGDTDGGNGTREVRRYRRRRGIPAFYPGRQNVFRAHCQ